MIQDKGFHNWLKIYSNDVPLNVTIIDHYAATLQEWCGSDALLTSRLNEELSLLVVLALESTLCIQNNCA